MSGQRTELPFTAIDEGIMHLELATNPWNIQAEIGSSARLDVDRLGKAVKAACALHPMARAAMKPWAGTETSYVWEVSDEPYAEPVQLVETDDLTALRSAFYSRRLALEVAPAFRAQVARTPEGDLFMLSISHVVADGVGVLRLLQSITRAYRGVEDPIEPVDLEVARDLTETLKPEGHQDRLRRSMDNMRMLRDAIGGPARIAVTTTTGEEGYGFVARRLDAESTSALAAWKPEGTTLNDVLLAALHVTIDRWNAERETPTGRVVVMMPFNVRPTDRFWAVMSNIVSFVNVGTVPKDRTDFETAVRAVARQSTLLKKARGAGLHDLANLGRGLPVGAFLSV